MAGRFSLIGCHKGLKACDGWRIRCYPMNMRFFFCHFAALFVLVIALTGCVPTEPRGPLVLAASSLQQPLEELAEQWTAAGNDPPQFSFASSAALARQIENGSAGDIFISADRQWTDYLTKAGNIAPSEVVAIAGNTLVVAAPVGPTPPSLQTLAQANRIVTGDTQAVPLGRYAKEALTAANLWDATEPKIINAASARGALVKLARGEVDAGILYASDAQGVETIAATPIPRESHSPIVYVAVKLPASAHPDTDGFLGFIASPDAVKVFDRYGFIRP